MCSGEFSKNLENVHRASSYTHTVFYTFRVSRTVLLQNNLVEKEFELSKRFIHLFIEHNNQRIEECFFKKCSNHVLVI